MDTLDDFFNTIGIMILWFLFFVVTMVIVGMIKWTIPGTVYLSEYTFTVDKNGGSDDCLNHIKSNDATQDIYFEAYTVYNDCGNRIKYGKVEAEKYSEFTDMNSIKNKTECKDMMEHKKSFVCKSKYSNHIMAIYIPDDEYDAIMDKLSNGETEIKGGSLN